MMFRCLLVALVLIAPGRAAAQPPASDPRAALDVIAGYAGFIDESLIGHRAVGATVRFQISRRLSIGPEVIFMAGPGRDRDLFLMGNVIVDFLQPRSGARAGRVNPYLVAGGGVMHQQTEFAGLSAVEGGLTAGGGARVWVTERLYALGEYRVGWEPHVRITGGIGVIW